MDTRIKRNRINLKGKMICIGIDMHKLSWRITALVEGEIELAITLAKLNYDSFKIILPQFKGAFVRIVYEPGPGGFYLYDRLTTDGLEYMVTPPSLIPIILPNDIDLNKKTHLSSEKWGLLFHRHSLYKGCLQ